MSDRKKDFAEWLGEPQANFEKFDDLDALTGARNDFSALLTGNRPVFEAWLEGSIVFGERPLIALCAKGDLIETHTEISDLDGKPSVYEIEWISPEIRLATWAKAGAPVIAPKKPGTSGGYARWFNAVECLELTPEPFWHGDALEVMGLRVVFNISKTLQRANVNGRGCFISFDSPDMLREAMRYISGLPADDYLATREEEIEEAARKAISRLEFDIYSADENDE